MGLATPTMPAKKIKVPSGIMLATTFIPATRIKVPSIMDVVISSKAAEIIKVTLKQDLMSVAAENGDGHIVGPIIGVVWMRRKLRKRTTDVIGGGSKSSV